MNNVRTFAVFALTLTLGCATTPGGGPLRNAALQVIGAEQAAWSQNAPPPKGLESIVDLVVMTARIDGIQYISDTGATVLITYKYTGRFRTNSGERAGSMTIQRKLLFTKNGGQWVVTGAPQETARQVAYRDRNADS